MLFNILISQILCNSLNKLIIFRLGEVTLQDFKAAVGRHSNFRYHFKSLDPEFGTVKEEASI